MWRVRTSFVILGSFAVLLLLILTDPELGLIQQMGVGASTLTIVISILITMFLIALLHITRKALLDYKSADFGMLLDKAGRTAEGAGYAAIAIALMCVAFSIVILAGVMVTK
jgi:hypothetical protein